MPAAWLVLGLQWLVILNCPLASGGTNANSAVLEMLCLTLSRWCLGTALPAPPSTRPSQPSSCLSTSPSHSSSLVACFPPPPVLAPLPQGPWGLDFLMLAWCPWSLPQLVFLCRDLHQEMPGRHAVTGSVLHCLTPVPRLRLRLVPRVLAGHPPSLLYSLQALDWEVSSLRPSALCPSALSLTSTESVLPGSQGEKRPPAVWHSRPLASQPISWPLTRCVVQFPPFGDSPFSACTHTQRFSYLQSHVCFSCMAALL